MQGARTTFNCKETKVVYFNSLFASTFMFEKVYLQNDAYVRYPIPTVHLPKMNPPHQKLFFTRNRKRMPSKRHEVESRKQSSDGKLLKES